MATPYAWTDEHSVTHVWPSFLSRHCTVHDRECSPWTPVTATDVLRMAAKDETLPDGVFVKLRRAVDGKTITSEGE